MVVNTSLPVSVIIAADQNPVCPNTTVTFTATPTNGGTTPAYQWKKNGTNVGSNSNTYAYIPVNGDLITCVLTSSLTCKMDTGKIWMAEDYLPCSRTGYINQIDHAVR